MITVQVNLDITVKALQTVVANTKKLCEKTTGGYRVDTADCLGKVISQFLYDRDLMRLPGIWITTEKALTLDHHF